MSMRPIANTCVRCNTMYYGNTMDLGAECPRCHPSFRIHTGPYIEEFNSGLREHAIPVVSGVLMYKDRITLIERNDWHWLSLERLCTPGGHVEQDETFHNALVRELKEEVGVDVEIIDHICSTTGYRGLELPMLYIQHHLCITEEEPFAACEKEVRGVQFLSLDEFKRANLMASAAIALEPISNSVELWLAGEFPGDAGGDKAP